MTQWWVGLLARIVVGIRARGWVGKMCVRLCVCVGVLVHVYVRECVGAHVRACVRACGCASSGPAAHVVTVLRAGVQSYSGSRVDTQCH